MSLNTDDDSVTSPTKNDDDSFTATSEKPSINDREKITVVVRIRPISKKGFKRNVFALDNKTIILEEPKNFGDNIYNERKQKVCSNKDQFIFDAVFSEDDSQEDVYNFTAKYLVNEVISGYNGTIFAYGATGSGKTYTLMAMNYYKNYDKINFSKCGIIVQAFKDLFSIIQTQQKNYVVTLSYMEIYNENIRDLFNNDTGYLELRGNNNVQIIGLNELVVTSAQQAIHLLEKGNEIRSVRSTGANIASSRSHAILIIILRQTFQQKEFDGFKTSTRQSKLLFVDLAGSERARRTKNKGKKLQEGGHINKSLLALGKCISALRNATNISHVNFRDSKLTRLLREPLTGNYHTIMIAQINPAMEYKEETKNTLIYASKARGISKKIKRNGLLHISNHFPGYHSLIVELRNEVARLKDKINDENTDRTIVRENSVAKKLRDAVINTFEEQMKLSRQLLDIDNHILFLNMEAEKEHQKISQWQSINNKLYRWKHISLLSDSASTDGPSDVNNVESSLSSIEKEQERYLKCRIEIIEKLDNLKRQTGTLENELHTLDKETEKELLTLLCRVHELQADKLSMVGERMIDAYELRRSCELLACYQKQQKISDNIITKQRQLIEEEGILMPTDLKKLYQLYQQEIHITTLQNIKEINDSEQFNFPSIKSLEKIPILNSERYQSKTSSISSSESNNESDGNKQLKSLILLPKLQSAPVTEHNRPQHPSPIPAAVLFPPITF